MQRLLSCLTATAGALVVAVWMLFFSTCPAPAQESAEIFIVRPFADIRYGHLLLLNRQPGAINQFYTEGNGTSFEIGTTFGVEILSTRFSDSELGGSLRAGIDIAQGEFQSDPYSSTAFDPEQQSPVYSSHRFTVEASSLSAYLEARLQYPVSGTLAAFAGPWTAYRFSASALQKETILSPQNATFSSGTNERVIAEGKSLMGPPVQYGMRMGLALDIPLSSALSFSQQLSLNINGSALASQDLMGALQPTLGFTFSFGTPAQPSPEILPYRPVLSFSIFALDSTGSRRDTAGLQTHAILNRRYLSLPPLLLVNQSTQLHSAFDILTTAGTDTFSIESLHDAPERDIYRQLPNILGRRLRTDNSSSLTLVPVSGKASRAQFPQAEAVRRYLIDAWAIDSTRVIIQPMHNTELPEGSVVLQPSAAALLAPLVLQSQEEHVEAPPIGIDRQIQPDTGWARWTVELQRNGRPVQTIDNNTPEPEKHIFSFPLSDTAQALLTARFTVFSAEGHETSVVDTLRITTDHSRSDTSTVHTYTLFLPLSGLGTMATVNDILLDHLRKCAGDSAAVTISASDPSSISYASDIGKRLLVDPSGARHADLSITREQAVPGDIPSFIRIKVKSPNPHR